jgi:hypothetical protein
VTAPPWTLADWQTAPANRWTFHHLREVVPTAQVFRGDDGRRPLPRGPGLDLDDVPVALTSGGTTVARSSPGPPPTASWCCTEGTS